MSTNEITGDTLVSKSSTEQYRNNWDSIFGKKAPIKEEPEQILISNTGYCSRCKDELTSYYVHDFKHCNCGKSFIDGGRFYTRHGGSLVSTAIWCKDDDIETIREHFTWGSYGPKGDQPKHYIKLKNLSLEHINAIIENQYHIKGSLTESFLLMEIKFREEN